MKVSFTFKLSSETALKTPNTAQAPHLSKYIVSMYPVGFMFNPPASKTRPLPIKE